MLQKIYRKHGEFCAYHPWEVIVIILTITACLITMDNSFMPPLSKDPPYQCQGQACHLYKIIDAIVMTAVRCIAILYSYYQLRNLYKLGSKYLLGIAGLFTVFSSFIFCSSVIKCLGGDISDLKDALFFFLLLIDLSKTTLLVQIALSSTNPKEIEGQIAKGMELIGPSLTLDTIVETLVISIGTLSGIKRLEVLSYYACLSVVINFIIFMTFYPACLSLILDLSRIENDNSKSEKVPSWQEKLMHRFQYFKTAIKNDYSLNKQNPVVERVKVIMSVGLVVVHLGSRWSLDEVEIERNLPISGAEHDLLMSEEPSFFEYLLTLINFSAEHIVILIIVLSLTVKFLFFEKPTRLETVDFVLDRVSKTEKSNLDSESPTYCEGCLKRINEDDNCDREFRPMEECLQIYKQYSNADLLSDTEIQQLITEKHIAGYQLEKVVKDAVRGVGIRRKIIGSASDCSQSLNNIPYKNYDYGKVAGVCCENVIGYMPVPLGVAGPLLLDNKEIYVPMATTEGCLVASTNRGCRALKTSGVISKVEDVGMTRGPVVRFPSVSQASEAKLWLQDAVHFKRLKEIFDSTSRFARLRRVEVRIAGRHLYIRFVAFTGDAMGMNMVSKGTEIALSHMLKEFPDMEIVSLSGNFCSDKKPAAINWISGRGKSVVCEAIIPGSIVRSVLKTTVKAMVDVNTTKNLMGSAVAGSIGGFNAHAANIVTAIYIATGQDPAQNVGSSNCMTLMEPWGRNGEDLYISCSMPSLEVGTIGGGTGLDAQSGCLTMLGVNGPHLTCPGKNAENLARIICGTVLAGELSLMAALTAGHLVKSHLQHNRCRQQ